MNNIVKQNNASNNKIPSGGITIGRRVKRALDSDLNQIIFIALCAGLILMIVILYKYTYSQVTKSTIDKVNQLRTTNTKLSEIRLRELETCQHTDSKYRHRLCDYYIASSYNTACVGQQHFDYVSEDMIARCLKNGARFIHLTVAADSTNQDVAKPVICTAIGQRITSMNTVSLRDALLAVRQNAFTYERTITPDGTNISAINYPLFIYLDLHTPYEVVLDQIANDIQDMLNDGLSCDESSSMSKLLVDASRYQSQPIGLAPVCDLLNQIIIFASPGYENSDKLSRIVVPIDSLHMSQVTDYERIMGLDPQQQAYMETGDMASKTVAANRYKTIDKIANLITDDMDYAFTNKKLDNMIGDDIVLRHMFNLSVVFPVKRPEDEQLRDSINPEVIPIMRQGAQFICMHYQVVDENIKQYLELFLHKYKSSFILKPDGMRLPPVAADLSNALNSYNTNNLGPLQSIITMSNMISEAVPADRVRSDIIDKFWRLTSSDGMILSITAGQLIVSLDTSTRPNPYTGEQTVNTGNKKTEVFQIREHPSSTKDNCLVMLVSLDGKYILTVDSGNEPQLQLLDTIKDTMAFYMEIIPADTVEPGSPPYYLMRVITRQVPTYLCLDKATRKPIISTISMLSTSPLSLIPGIAIDIKEAVVRRQVQIWMQHPQLGLRFVSVFGGNQLGLTGNVQRQVKLEIRRVTEDGLIALVIPPSLGIDIASGVSKYVGKIVIHDASSGQVRVVPYGEHNIGNRKWKFLIIKQNGGRVYLDDEDGYRLGALADGRLRWQATWPISESAVTEFYIKEINMEIVG